MKRLVAIVLLAAVLLSSAAGVSRAVDEYDDSQSHPLRIAVYLVHPVGVLLEWMLFRPFHYLVSQPEAETVFGHTAHMLGDE